MDASDLDHFWCHGALVMENRVRVGEDQTDVLLQDVRWRAAGEDLIHLGLNGGIGGNLPVDDVMDAHQQGVEDPLDEAHPVAEWEQDVWDMLRVVRFSQDAGETGVKAVLDVKWIGDQDRDANITNIKCQILPH